MAILVTVCHASISDGQLLGGYVVSFLFFLVFVGAICAFVVLRSGESARFETQAAPSQVIMAATAQVGTGRRWAIAHQTDHSLIFNYTKKPSKIIAFVGILFFFFPGVIYLILAGKKETLTFQLDRSTGNTIVQMTSNGFRGKSAGRGVRTQLGVVAGTTAVQAHTVSASHTPPAPIQSTQQQPPLPLHTQEIATKMYEPGTPA